MLTVPEVFTHSSNIGTARMALMVGVEGHKAFLKKMGQLDRLRTELPESAEPLVPKRWGELNTMTIAFGQGLNVAPIQAVMAVCALVNGGKMMVPTFLPRTPGEAAKVSHRVVSEQTSELMRYLDALQRDARLGELRQHSGLLCRRQDRHGRQDHPRALFGKQGVHDLHGDHAGRQAEIPVPDHLRRSGSRRRRITATTPPPTTPGGSRAR